MNVYLVMSFPTLILPTLFDFTLSGVMKEGLGLFYTEVVEVFLMSCDAGEVETCQWDHINCSLFLLSCYEDSHNYNDKLNSKTVRDKSWLLIGKRNIMPKTVSWASHRNRQLTAPISITLILLTGPDSVHSLDSVSPSYHILCMSALINLSNSATFM